MPDKFKEDAIPNTLFKIAKVTGLIPNYWLSVLCSSTIEMAHANNVKLLHGGV